MSALFALIASLSWGVGDFLGGLTARRIHPFAVYGLSQIAGLVVLGIAVLVTGAWAGPGGYWPWALAGSVCGLVGMTLFYSALATGHMGIVSPIVALAVLVPLAVGLVRGERPSALQLVGVAIAIGGIVLASGPELTGAESARPVLLALAAAGVLGFMFIVMAEGSAIDPLMTMFGIRVGGVTLAVVIFAFIRNVGGATSREILPLAIIGVLDATANLTYGIATTLGLLSIVSVLGSLYPIVTVLLAWWILKERLKKIQYYGVAAALIGVAFISAAG